MHSTDATFPLFPIAAILGLVLVLIPLPWHLRAWNSGTCFFIMWTALSCLNQAVNSLVWAGNVLNVAPAWCEISTRITIGASVGIPAASLCINYRLFSISRMKAVYVTHAEKRRAILIDTAICVLFPIIFVAMSYIVQGHRFNILEDVGCYTAIFNTPPAYLLVYSWPVIIGMISFVFAGLSILRFSKCRAEISQFASKNSAFTPSRYLRLMALSSTEMLCTTPLSLFVIVLNATATPVSPWVSWEDTHFDFGRIIQVPAVAWRADHLSLISIELSRWLNPLCAFIFFAYFGFASEARRHYADAGKYLLKKVGLEGVLQRYRFPRVRLPSTPSKSTKFGSVTLPVYATPSTKSGFNKFASPSESTLADSKTLDVPLTPLQRMPSIAYSFTSTYTASPSTPSSPTDSSKHRL